MDYVRELRVLVGHRPLLLPVAAVLIIDEAGQVLLQRRGDNGRWSIPGGAMEPGESFGDAARREAREETGLMVARLTLVDVFSGPEFFIEYPNGDQVFLMGTTFVADEVHGDLIPDAHETLELRHFPLDALPIDTLPTSRLILERYQMTPLEVTAPGAALGSRPE
jgi:8-oxo-dGTP pyrophosphatase MutT (NUDIX family)